MIRIVRTLNIKYSIIFLTILFMTWSTIAPSTKNFFFILWVSQQKIVVSYLHIMSVLKLDFMDFNILSCTNIKQYNILKVPIKYYIRSCLV